MPIAGAGPGSAQRRAPLDPFVLPSETDAHFTLLIVAVVGASVVLYAMLFNSIPAFWEARTALLERCTAAAAAAAPAATFAADVERTRLTNACQWPMFALKVGWQVGGCAALLAASLALYWWLPARTLRRSGFRLLKEAEAADMVASVRALSQELGLRRMPILVWNPLNRSSGGVAFGRWGRRYLGLYGGTYLRSRRDPELFRAVMLHELAHIRNADLDKAGLAVTVWWAFLAVCLLPAGLGVLLGGLATPLTPLALGWRLVAMAGLVVLTRAAVLRSRELYADQRASAWDGSNAAISRAVGLLGDAPAPHRWWLPAFVQRALALHPSADERQATLGAPALLFRARAWAALGAGVATTVGLEGVGSMLGSLLPFDQGQLSSILASVVFAPLAVGIVGLIIWREEAFHEYAGAEGETRSAAGLGLALGTGMFIGWHLSLTSYAFDTSPQVLTGGARLTFELTFAAIVLGSMTLFAVWLQTGARAWIQSRSLLRGPLRQTLLASVLAATCVLVLWLGFVSYTVHAGLTAQTLLAQSDVSQQLTEFGIPVSDSPEIAVLVEVFGVASLVLMGLPLTPLGLAVLWVFPLAARAVTRPRSQGQAGLLVRSALITSLVAGVLAATLSVMFLLAIAETGNVFLAAIASMLLLAVFQAAAGLLILARATWMAVLQGIATAHLTGAVTSAVLVGAATVVGLDVPAQVSLMLFSGGTIVASAAILAIASGVPVLRQSRSIAAWQSPRSTVGRG